MLGSIRQTDTAKYAKEKAPSLSPKHTSPGAKLDFLPGPLPPPTECLREGTAGQPPGTGGHQGESCRSPAHNGLFHQDTQESRSGAELPAGLSLQAAGPSRLQ